MSMGYSKEVNAWYGPFLMAMVNGNCVRRSNALSNYGSNVTYSEAIVFPSFMAGFVTLVQLAFLAVALAFPPLAWILRMVSYYLHNMSLSVMMQVVMLLTRIL